jgi:gluconolactonase
MKGNAMNWTRRSTLAAGGGFALAACTPPAPPAAPAIDPAKVLGEVTAISPDLAAIVPAGAVSEKLAEGFTWAEGPLWIKDGGYLLFTDVPGNCLYKWTQAEGATEFLKPSGFAGADSSHLREGGANGLTREASGAVLMCDSGNRNVSRLDLATKQKTIVVEKYQGKRFNSPNDVVVHSSGAIYFTDPPYGLAGTTDSPLREIAFHGIYRVAPDGTIAVIDDKVVYPNGIAFSPDEKTLYVSSSDEVKPLVMAYQIGDDGMPTSSAVFLDAVPLKGEGKVGNPDGMAIDKDGRLFMSGPGGVLIISPQAELLGVIGVGEGRAVANCKFGDADGSTLYLTAHECLGRIKLNTKGVGWA